METLCNDARMKTEADSLIYVHPQETWNETECLKISKANGRDAFGTKQRPGLIASSASPYVSYGQTVRFNGGCERNGQWYEGEMKPLPIVPKGWIFKTIPT